MWTVALRAVTPEEIAASAIEAALAGTAVTHIRERDPKTRKGSRNPALYREVVQRIGNSQWRRPRSGWA